MTKPIAYTTVFSVLFLAYFPALKSLFVKDDLILILSADGDILKLFTHSWPGGFFRPSAELAYSIQHAFFGLHPFPYHLLSLVSHGAATALLHLLLLRLLNNPKQSQIGALIFALHPLHTESVSWISGQMSMFSGLFTLALLTLPYRGRRIWLAIPPLVVLIGLGFYENFVIAPMLLFAIYAGSKRMRHHADPKHFAAAITLTVFPTVLFLYWRFVFLGLRGGNYSVMPSIGKTLTNLCYYFYLLLGGNAVGGRIIYYQPELIFSTDHFLYVFPPLLIATLLIFLTGIFLYGHSRIRGEKSCSTSEITLPILWFLTALLPVLFLPERPRRLSYMSVPPFAISLAMLMTYLQQQTRSRMVFVQAGLFSYILIMAITLHVRNIDWQRAGEIESKIPALIHRNSYCASLIFDVPNLLGDALFFNSLSQQRWLSQTSKRSISIYDAQHLPIEQNRQMPICFFRYYKGRLEGIQSMTSPYFSKGRNWVISPSPPEANE